MSGTGTRPFGRNYAFVVIGVIFLCLLVAAGLRAAPGQLIYPLHHAFGWSIDTISWSGALGLLFYGLMGPFAGALMARYGVRFVLLSALILMSASVGASLLMSEVWHLIATWGVLSGIASGCVAMVLGATVASRWFSTRRGLVMGVLSASMATGTLIFQPGLAKLNEMGGWSWMVWSILLASVALIPLVFFLVPDKPSDIGLLPYGADRQAPAPPPAPQQGLIDASLGVLMRAARTRVFWYLFATFFVCGFTTNGLVGMHFVSFCIDRGIPQIHAASLMAMMGVFDLVGTTLSGWLTDRYDPRKLLFFYYAARGLSLIYLPFSDFSLYSLSLFGIFYGLDWIATVPPTIRLTTDFFGDRDAPVVFGWIAVGHQIGAASAAALGGYLRVLQGSYAESFILSGMMGLIAAFVALLIVRRHKTPVTV